MSTLPQYHPYLHKAAYNLCRCRSTAEDLVQETFEKVLLGDFTITKTLLIRILRTTWYNHLRKTEVAKRNEAEYAHRKGSFTQNDALQNLSDKDVRSAVDLLSPRYAQYLHLLMDGYPINEIPQHLNISYPMGLLTGCRARKSFRRKINPESLGINKKSK